MPRTTVDPESGCNITHFLRDGQKQIAKSSYLWGLQERTHSLPGMIRLKGIKNIVFDFGGVLVDLNPKKSLDAFAALGMSKVTEFLTLYGHSGPFGQIENGDIGVEQFHDAVRALFGVTATNDQIDHAWLSFLGDIPVAKMRMVHELSKTYRVFLLSNTNPIHIRRLNDFNENGYPLAECFEKCYFSYEIGLSKPGKKIFEYVLNDAGLVPEETLFIDDGPDNCTTARVLGIRTYQPQPFEDISTQLIRPASCVATMGFFDGVHRGHQYLIDKTIQLASERGLPSLVISFWPHPRMVLHADFYPQLLTDQDERTALLQNSGADFHLLLDFDMSLASLSASEFMSILKEEWHVSTLMVGFDHRFGNSRTDGINDYMKYGRELGIEVLQAEPFFLSAVLDKKDVPVCSVSLQPVLAHPDKTTISSSLIRRLILAGEMEVANRASGRPYSISGVVVGGHHIGNSLGYPTANIQPISPNKLVPAIGVYAVWVLIEGVFYKGMLNIGRRPTLHAESPIVIEVHVLNFSGDLYGNVLTIHFMKRIRQEEHFPNIEALVERMHQDRTIADSYLSVPPDKV